MSVTQELHPPIVPRAYGINTTEEKALFLIVLEVVSTFEACLDCEVPWKHRIKVDPHSGAFSWQCDVCEAQESRPLHEWEIDEVLKLCGQWVQEENELRKERKEIARALLDQFQSSMNNRPWKQRTEFSVESPLASKNTPVLKVQIHLFPARSMASQAKRKAFEKNHINYRSKCMLVPTKVSRLVFEGDISIARRGLVFEEEPLAQISLDEPGSSLLRATEDDPPEMVVDHEEPMMPETPKVEEPKKSTQTANTMAEFIELLLLLIHLILSREATNDVRTSCPCGSGAARTVQCHDCYKYETSCEQCFVNRHANNPFHWPKMWQREGFYRKMDIACLLSHTYAIHLCSKAARCLNPSPPQKVTVGDTNSIHSTVISYCGCDGVAKPLEQLMSAGLFPATVKAPRTMMTFRVLDEFNEHHLASKKAAYDYVAALRRLTDGAFTPAVADPYSQFLFVMRIWRCLCADKHTGQAFNLSHFFPHRIPGSLVTFCVCCPEEGFNMEKGWERTPEELRHLNQRRRMADGNYQLNQFMKNNDPDDVSLETANGIGYFPDEDEIKAYLQRTKEEQEKSTCNYLKVVNNQNQKKFKNMQISDVVNIACSHVIISASVNLDKGEGFRYTDMALKQSLSHTRHNRDIDYYGRRMIYCLTTHIVERTRCSIPELHIEGHSRKKCVYRFHPAYIPGAGKFNGEGIEQPWAEMNQVGPATRQMNHGHRIGVITAHYTYWNWQKIIKTHISLTDDYRNANELFQEKSDFFLQLCVSFADRIPGWLELERNSQRLPNGIVEGIYEHSESKAPSKEKQGIAIQQLQQRVRGKLTLNQTETVQKDIRNQRQEISDEIEELRHLQAVVMPRLSDVIGTKEEGEVSKVEDAEDGEVIVVEVEDEQLYLPSDLTSSQREALKLTSLVEMEQQICVGELYDAVKSVQRAAKAYSVTHTKKREDDRGTNAGLRSVLALKKIEVERNSCIADYNCAWQALISLEFPTAKEVPVMHVRDTLRRSTFQARQVGDTRRMDASLFHLPELMDNVDEESEGEDKGENVVDNIVAGTDSMRRIRGSRKLPDKDKKTKKHAKEDGWIWTTVLAVGANRPDEDATLYEEESDRIQWFRAREEVERLREKLETVHAEFLNALRGFRRMQQIWSETADLEAVPPASETYPHRTWSFGHAAFAQRQAKICEQLYNTLKTTFDQHRFEAVPEGGILADVVARQRKQSQMKLQEMITEHLKQASEFTTRIGQQAS
ncbi:hypothetical protein BT96DRAFT_994712 [Gymnopus androsaceus JB14]|uniref:CxC2-like cysteine cluster KDZ transposase-associated domain-containing protein n=1 Tax=Gymnopus androsaceus JB14 TaxID=1447944 RepID=A0A6A4HNQ0_9AGAR|nr:hypothetical protein BT96DRAFT_994712 [Gymnopus androsaceus JB14]